MNFVFNSLDDIKSAYGNIISDVVQGIQEARSKYGKSKMLDLTQKLYLLYRSCGAMTRHIFKLLLSCSSPEYPHKLLAKLFNNIGSAVNLIQTKVLFDDGNVLPRASNAYATANKILSLVTLLSESLKCFESTPLLESSDISNDSSYYIVVHQYINLTANALFLSIQQLHGIIEASSAYPLDCAFDDNVSGFQLSTLCLFCNSAIGCMELMETKFVIDENNTRSFLVFNSMLSLLHDMWSDLNSNLKLIMLKILKEFFIRNEFDNSVLQSQNIIRKFALMIMSDSTAVIEIRDAVNVLFSFLSFKI